MFVIQVVLYPVRHNYSFRLNLMAPSGEYEYDIIW